MFFAHSLPSRLKIRILSFFDEGKKITKIGKSFMLISSLSIFSSYVESIFFWKDNQNLKVVVGCSLASI
jgi:hypothetical protein